MLVKFLRKDGPEVLLVLLLVTVGVWLRSVVGLTGMLSVAELTYGTPVELLINQFNLAFPQLSVYSAFVVMVLVLVQMHSLNNRYIFLPQRTFLPLVLYVLIGFSFLSVQHLTAALVALPFIILALGNLFASYRKDYAEADVFLAGFFLSLAGVLYLPAITLVLTLVFGLIIMRSFSWREWLSMLAGVVVPLAMLFVYNLFVNLDMYEDLTKFDFSKFIPAIPPSINSFFGYLFVGVILLAFLLSALFLVGWTASQKVRTNKIYLVFFFLIVNTYLSYLLVPIVSKEIIVIAAVPASFIIGVYMVFVRRTFAADAILILLLMLSVLLQIFPE